MRRIALHMLGLSLALAVSPLAIGALATLDVPSDDGRLIIDGKLDDPLWQHAAVMTLQAIGFGRPFPGDGETRAAKRGKYLCLSARLPEPEHVVALSIGRNPIFLPEDRIVWTFYTYATGKLRKSIVLTVNPLGGFRLDGTIPVGANQPWTRIVGGIEAGEDWRSNDSPVYLLPVEPEVNGEQPMAASQIGAHEWTVEAAIPIEYFDSTFGYMEVERIRVARPDAPELSWRWPGAHLRSEFRLAQHTGDVAAPLFHPILLGDAPDVGIPHFTRLPEFTSTNRGWQSSRTLQLKRDDGSPRRPEFPTEVRLAHDGQTLALFAQMAEPASMAARPQIEDSLQVILSPSGAGFVQITAQADGMPLICRMGNGAGGRSWEIACADSKISGASSWGTSGWVLNINLPLKAIAELLRESSLTGQWRLMIRRSHASQKSSRAEITSFPLVRSAAPLCPARYAHLTLLPAGAAKSGGTPDSGQNRQDGIAAELTRLRSNVWSAAERNALGIDRMLETELRARMAGAAERERRDWEKVHTRADWEHFRRQRLDALRNWIGMFPDRSPLHAAVTKRANYGDSFVIENIVFESRPHFLVTANLYLPEKISGRIPAILAVHCHHAGKTQSELQDMGMNWARAGAAVLVMDQIGAGERVQTHPWEREGYYSHYNLEIQLELAGESLMKWMVWDLMRGIDLMIERPYVDSQRIAIVGSVAGGGDPAAVAAALDDRVAAVVPFNFGEAGPEEHYQRGPRGYDFNTAWPGWGSWDVVRNLPRSVADQFFPWFICASVAPRRFVYAFEMGWPHGVESQPAWARYRKVFDFYDQSENLAEVHGFGEFPGPGERPNVGVEHRWGIYPILKRWLDIGVPTEEYHNPRPRAELACLNPAVVAGTVPRTANLIELGVAKERLQAARAQAVGMDAATRVNRLRNILSARLGNIEPNMKAQARTVWSKSLARFKVEALSLDVEPGISVPMLLLKPGAQSKPERPPVVLAFAQAGKDRFLSDRSNELARLLEHGVAICLADVRGTGETAAGSSRAPSGMTLATVELMLGNTMMGAQLKDVRTVLKYLSQRTDLDHRVALWGDSFSGVNSHRTSMNESPSFQVGPDIHEQAEPLGGMLALLTALYEDGVQAIAVSRGLASYVSVLRDRFSYMPLDAMIPGILESADVPDIAGALFPRAVLLEGLVDGRNEALRLTDLASEMAQTYESYRGRPSQLVIRENTDFDISYWLAQQCQGR